MGLSVWQILIIVLVVVLLFGAGKIPRLMKDMGSGINAFRRGLKEEDSDSTGDKATGAAKTVEDTKPAIDAEIDEPVVKPASGAKRTAAKKPAAKKKSAGG